MDRQLEMAGVPFLDLDETDELGRWHGPAVAVALGLVAAFRAQEDRLGLGFSTPSALVVMPRLWPRPTTERTIAAASVLRPRSATKERSILILSNGKRRR